MSDKTKVNARRPQDTVGFCMACNELVRRTPKADCPHDHPAEIVFGALDVAPDEDIPQLPRFNWAAFFMPPIWGVAHGAPVAGLIVLPLWLFLDSNIQSAVYGVDAATPLSMRIGVYAMAGLIALLTMALMVWFGKTGWGVAWRRQYGDGQSSTSMKQFVKEERRWYWVCIPLFFILLGYAIFYWITILPGVYGTALAA